MKLKNFAVALSLIALSLLTSCGPDTITPTPNPNPTPKTGPKPKPVTPTEVYKNKLTTQKSSQQPRETLQLTATTTPANAQVTYSVDYPSMATVSETGLVKAIAPGIVTVTAQAGTKKATCMIKIAKASDVMLVNLLDQKKYPAGKTIDYTVSASKDEAESYELRLSFSVLKTANYNFALSFSKRTSGTVCIGSCELFENQTSYTKDIKLTADEEGIPDEKDKGAMTPMSTHIEIPNAKAGQTYTNTIKVTLTPKAGGAPLTWTINLTVKVI